MAGFVNGEISILMLLMLEVRTWSFLEPKSLWEIEITTNTLDRQRLRRFVKEHPILIHTQHTNVDNKYFLGFYISHWLCDFIFDPSRSQSLYSTSLVTSKCRQAIEVFIAQNSSFYPEEFFVRRDGREISDASRLLEHAKNGSDSDDLLLFLQYLSKIYWRYFYTRGFQERLLTHRIIQWVCMTLVS